MPAIFVGIVVSVVIAGSSVVAAAPPTADQIMQRVEDKSFGKDATATHSLVIIPKHGEKRYRRYTIIRKEYKDVIKLVTFFTAPTDVQNAAFMVWDNKNSDDQRWIYLPAIGQVRQLVAGDSRQSFFGSDFVLEDFTNRDPDQDTHKLSGSQKVDDWDCWVVDSTPKNLKSVEFASMRSWVAKDSDLVIRQELKNAQGKTIRTVQAKSIQTIEGIQTYMQLVVDNLETGSESRLEASDVHYNQGVPDERFEEGQLSRGAPKK